MSGQRRVIYKQIDQNKRFDSVIDGVAPPGDSAVTGDILVVRGDWVTVVPQDGASDGDVLTLDSSSDWGVSWQAGGGGGGGGAPTNATYLVVSLNGTLTNERRFQVGTGLQITDGGPDGDFTISPANDLGALEAFTTEIGFVTRTSTTPTYTARTHTQGDGILITDGNGVAGNPTYAVNRATFSVDPRFGDASDGNVTIAVDTVMTRTMNYRNLTINAGVIVINSGCIVNVRETLTMGVGAEIKSAGNGGGVPAGSVINGGLSNNSAGNAGGTVGPLGRGGNGGLGGVAASGSLSAAVGNCWSQHDTLGDTTTGKGGQGGGNGVQNGGTVGLVTQPTAADGWTADTLHRGMTVAAAIRVLQGGSGGSGGGSTAGFGGGGAAGGGVVVVNARRVSAAGATLRADGGNGGAAVASSTNGGGGGGGGGGKVYLLYETAPGGLPSMSAAGGAGGGKTGTGTVGASGAAGTTEATCILP